MNAKTSKTGSINYAILFIALTMCSLTGCNTVSSASGASSRQLYQPPILSLPAGIPVQTTEGTYTPQTHEVWHSAARFRAIEQQAQNLAAALQEAKAQPLQSSP